MPSSSSFSYPVTNFCIQEDKNRDTLHPIFIHFLNLYLNLYNLYFLFQICLISYFCDIERS